MGFTPRQPPTRTPKIVQYVANGIMLTTIVAIFVIVLLALAIFAHTLLRYW